MVRQLSDIQITSSLIEDYFPMAEPPVIAADAGKFAVSTDRSGAAPIHHILTVDPSGKFVHLRQAATSDSGWLAATGSVQPPGSAAGSISHIHAFHRQAVLTALFQFEQTSATTLMEWTETSGWHSAQLQSDAGAVLAAISGAHSFTDASGFSYFYGRVAAGSSNHSNQAENLFILAHDDVNNAWTVAYNGPASDDIQPNDFCYLIQTNDGPNTFLIVAVRPDGYVGCIEKSIANPGSANPTIQPGGRLNWSYCGFTEALDYTRLVILPNRAADFAVLRGVNDLWLLVAGRQGGEPVYTPIMAGPKLIFPDTSLGRPKDFGFLCGGLGGGPGSDVGCTLFAIDKATQELWIARASRDTSGDLSRILGAWSPLGNKARIIASPRHMAGRAEVFLVDDETNPYHLSQSAIDSTWAGRKIAVPDANPKAWRAVAALTMRIKTVDANKVPLPFVELTVSADQATRVIFNGVTHFLTRNASAPVVTDITGAATVIMEMTGLIAPRLAYAAKYQFITPVSRWCQGDVIEVKEGETPRVNPSSIAHRLAGLDPNFPVDEETLLKHKLIDPNYPDKAAAVEAIKTTAKLLLQHTQLGTDNIKTRDAPISGWTIDFKGSAGSAFRMLEAGEAAEILARVAGIEPGKRRSIFDFFEEKLGAVTDIGSKVADLAGDGLNFFKNKWDDVQHLHVLPFDSPGDGAPDPSKLPDGIALVVNEGTSAAQTFVVSTVRQASAAMELVFTRIAEDSDKVASDLSDVVNWLKQLFSWDDVQVTSDVIRLFANAFFDQVKQEAKQVKDLIHSHVPTLRQELEAKLKQADQVFGRDSFNAFADAKAGGKTRSATSHVLDGDLVRNAYELNISQLDYVYRKIKGTVGPVLNSSFSKAATATGSAALTDTFASWVALGNSGPVTDMENYLRSGLADPSRLFDLVIVEFLAKIEAILPLVSDGLETVATKMIDAFLLVLDDLRAQLNKPLLAELAGPVGWIVNHVIPLTSKLPKPGFRSDFDPNLSMLDVLCLSSAVPAVVLSKAILGRAPIRATDAVQQLKTLHLPQFFAFEDQGAASGKRSLWDALLNDVAIVAGFMNVGNFIFSAASDGYAAVDLNKTQRQAWFNADPRTRPPKQPDKLDLPLFSSSPDPGVILSLYTWWFGYVTQLLSFPADLFLQKKEAGGVSINKADGFYLGLWAAGVPPVVYDVVSIMVQGKLVRNSWPIIDTLQGFLAAGVGGAAIIFAVLPEHDPDYNWLALVNDGLQWGNVPKVFLAQPEDPVVLGVLAFEVVIGIADSATLIGSTIWSDASLTQPQTSSSAS